MKTPRALMVSSVVPDTTGSGHPMRVGIFLEALAQVAAVDLIVPSVLPGSSWRLPVRLGALMGTFPLDQAPPTLMALARSLPDAKGREAAFLSYGKPSGTACISTAALEYMNNLGRMRSYDLVHVCRLWMAEAGLAAANPRSRLTLDLDEDDYTSSESMAQLWSSRGREHAARMRRLEAAASDRMLRSVAPKFERLWISNRDDAATLTARHNEINVEVVPNAVQIPEHPRRRDDGSTLLFVGSFNYEPNVEGVLWFVSSVWPRLLKRSTRPLRLVIAGPNPPASIRALARPSLLSRLRGGRGEVAVLGWVPELRPLYEKATVAIAPLRAGKGSRLKLLEAAAEGVAVVSTTAAAHGLQRAPLWAWLADDENSFAEACAKALSDPDERRRRVAEGRSLAVQEYDRSKVIRALTEEMLNVLGRE